MRRLPAILGLLAVVAAAGCGGHNSAPTAAGTALRAGPSLGGSAWKPPPPPPLKSGPSRP
jgi:hypothetical protein